MMENDNMDDEDEIDGRFMDRVNEYASTCDGCQELTSHDEMVMDKNTQLGYCPDCVKHGRLPTNFVDSESEQPKTKDGNKE